MNRAKLQALAGLGVGLAALLLAVVVLDRQQQTSSTFSQAVSDSQPAAAWWSVYSRYDGSWPVAHNLPTGSVIPGHCSTCGGLPSYADIYVQSNTAQRIVSALYLYNSGVGFAKNGQWSYSGPSYSGSLPTVTSGTPLVIEWACDDFQARGYSYSGQCTSYDAFNNCIGYAPGSGGTNFWYNYGSSVGVNFTAGGNLGTVIVKPTQTTTYKLYCRSRGAPDPGPYAGLVPDSPNFSFTVNVTAAPQPPTLTITGNNTNPTTVTIGQVVLIAGGYTAASGDTLTKTALNDSNSNALPGVAWTPPVSKTYNFSTTTPGAYTFYPATQTTLLPSWNNYSKSLVVTVNCPVNATKQSNKCVCNAGYQMQGNACVVTPACVGTNQINPPTCQCDVGYTLQGGSCVPASCPGAHQVLPLCSTCDAGYLMQAGSCVLTAPTLSISASPARVKPGTPVKVTWSVTGITAGQSCSIFSVPAGVFSQTMPAGTAPTWSGNANTAGITGTAVLTLSCTGTTPRSVTVGLLPGYKEQ